MSAKNPSDNLTFEDFRTLAQDPSLSRHEKVGFPDSYREGNEPAIFADVRRRLSNLDRPGQTVLEIGPGCSALPIMLANLCAARQHRLLFVDSAEMLAHLPDESFVSKFAGRFPEVPPLVTQYRQEVNCILAYSVLQYVFAEDNVYRFLDCALDLLAPEGQLLLGDIPNNTMRKRFFASPRGEQLHREFTGRDEKPTVQFNRLDPALIDDSVVLAILGRARAAGYHAWVVPQSDDLPMANRREDILIRRP